MFFVRVVVVAVFIILLSACGGGGASCESPSCEEPAGIFHVTGVPHSHGDGHGGLNPGEVRETAPRAPNPPGHAAPDATAPETAVVSSHSHEPDGNVHSPPATVLSPSDMRVGTDACVQQTASRDISLLFEEQFSDGNTCRANDRFWDLIIGQPQRISNQCKLVYHVYRGADEQENAKVSMHAALHELTGLEFHRRLRVEWTEHFTPGYEFPSGSQKLARFFVASGSGHETNVMLLGEGKLVQGTVFIRGHDRRGDEAWFEVDSYLEFPDGLPLGRDIEFSLDVQLPSGTEDGWIAFSADGHEAHHAIPALGGMSNGCVPGFDGVWVGGNWTNMGTPSRRDSVRYIDNIRVYAQSR